MKIIRPITYFLGGFLPAWIAQAKTMSEVDVAAYTWLDWSVLAAVSLLGGVMAVRAFYDGAAAK